MLSPLNLFIFLAVLEWQASNDSQRIAGRRMAGREWEAENGRQGMARREWQAQKSRQRMAGRERQAQNGRQEMFEDRLLALCCLYSFYKEQYTGPDKAFCHGMRVNSYEALYSLDQ